MWAQLEQKIVRPGKVSAIEITLLPDDKLQVNGVTLVTKKNNIIVTGKVSAAQSIEAALKQLPKSNPICVVLNGRGVLVKKLPGGQTGNPVPALLPNANPADFYFELLQCDQFVAAAIVRRELIEKYLGPLKTAGYRILQVSLGFAAMQYILSFINVENGQPVITNSFILKTGNEQNVADFSQSENITTEKFQMTEYAVGDQYVLSSHLLSFAVGLGLLADELKQPARIDFPFIANERTEFRFFKLFRATGVFVLGLVFLLLLINFMIYSYYFNKNRAMQVSQSFSRAHMQQVSAQLEAINRKELFLRNSGWTKPGRLSFYADRIASLTPANTLLTTMAIHPVKSNTTGMTPVVNFKTDTIQLAGTCDNAVEINQFINNLKIIADFREVSLKNYSYKKEQDAASFSIEIITR